MWIKSSNYLNGRMVKLCIYCFATSALYAHRKLIVGNVLSYENVAFHYVLMLDPA